MTSFNNHNDTRYCDTVYERMQLKARFCWPNAFAVRFTLVHFGRMRGQNHYVSLRFNMASVDIKKFENKLGLGTR